MVDVCAHQLLDQATVCLLQWPEAANIKWLTLVRGVCRHVECDDLIVPAVELELGGVVAFVAVEDQQPVYALCPGRRMVVEVLDPLKANYIGNPAIVGSRNALVEW